MDSSMISLEHDRNNNTTIGKSYSLRPRAATRREDQEADQEDLWKPRGRSKKKPKQKSAPLSKYRRKSANARERFRMREINEAFEALRRAIPHLSSSCENPNEKMTKISTLRMAMKYITALSNALQDADFDSDADSFFSEWTTSPDVRESSTPSSVNDHFDLYDQFLSLSSSSESSPSITSQYSLSKLLTPPPSEIFSPATCKLNVPSSCNSFKPNFSATSGKVLPSPPNSLVSSAIFSKSFISPPCPSTADLEDITHHLISSEDLQNCSPSLLDELDISSPSVDLEEFLIT